MKPRTITDALPETIDLRESGECPETYADNSGYLDVARTAAYRSLLISYAVLRKANPWRLPN